MNAADRQSHKGWILASIVPGTLREMMQSQARRISSDSDKPTGGLAYHACRMMGRNS